jgi:ornithine carbamoyltransferase
MRHFLKETDLSPAEVAGVFATAAAMKHGRGRHTPPSLARQSWGLLFFKKSTRTRVSFQVGVHELGGQPVMLSADEMQLSRGESVADSARVLSRYLHGMVIRCYDHATLEEFVKHGTVPVVNALSDFLHPCQLYTDLFTLAERWSGGDAGKMVECLRGKKIAFLGDTACNVANSFVLGCAHLGIELVLSGPKGFEPGPEIRAQLKKDGLKENFTFTSDPVEAVRGADMVTTDVWVSMGMEAEKAERLRIMQPYQVNAALMKLAKPGAYFMHCLPAHPGEEVSLEVLEGPQSIVFDQAENRLHLQKALLAHLAASRV